MYCRIKRFLDLVIALMLLAVLGLPMLVIMMIIRKDSRGPSVFRQERVGKDGRVFVCLKFRTMYTYAPSELSTLEFSDAERYITPVGRVLRRTSLDELPQLINVIKGDMSIIGPRPLIPREEEMHKSRLDAGVYSLRPGITGLAQVNGRDTLSDREKLAWDTEYLKNVGLFLDLKIICYTLIRVTTGKGIASAGGEKHFEG